MTFNEFKFCCIMFTKAFEGRKYGEVVDGCYPYDKDCIISLNKICFTSSSKRFRYYSQPAVFVYHGRAVMIYKENVSDVYFYNVQDFLNHFKISYEDIV